MNIKYVWELEKVLITWQLGFLIITFKHSYFHTGIKKWISRRIAARNKTASSLGLQYNIKKKNAATTRQTFKQSINTDSGPVTMTSFTVYIERFLFRCYSYINSFKLLFQSMFSRSAIRAYSTRSARVRNKDNVSMNFLSMRNTLQN